jgi:Transcriptional regulatory protein, C terminal
MRLNFSGRFRNIGFAICGRQRQLENLMNAEKVLHLAKLTHQLAEIIMAAAICAEEMRTGVQSELDGTSNAAIGLSDRNMPLNPPSANERPILHESTLRVNWKGKSLHLGHTRSYWLLDRLTRRPNQYVTHLDLLHDVWDDEELSTSTIRSAVRHLRRKLRVGDMEGLADAIRGHNGRYILVL